MDRHTLESPDAEIFAIDTHRVALLASYRTLCDLHEEAKDGGAGDINNLANVFAASNAVGSALYEIEMSMLRIVPTTAAGLDAQCEILRQQRNPNDQCPVLCGILKNVKAMADRESATGTPGTLGTGDA